MLKELFDKHKCDKGTEKHHYYKDYEQYFEKRREEPLNFLEIGTFKGASTRAFYDYFPNANIYTIDIFERTDPKDLDILHEDRVHWMKADSMSATLPRNIKKEWDDIEFDFVIDNDGTKEELYAKIDGLIVSNKITNPPAKSTGTAQPLAIGANSF